MTRIRIVFAPDARDQPPRQQIVDETGQVLERGDLVLAAEVEPLRTVLIVPGAWAAARWLPLPTRNDAQARDAAALAMEDELATPGEAVHLALGPLEPDGQRLVVTTARGRVQGWLEMSALYGLAPDVLIPDHLALAEPPNGDAVAVRRGSVVAVRGERVAFTAESDLLPVLLSDRSVEIVEGQADGERLLRIGALHPPVNLLQGDFDPRRNQTLTSRDWRRLAVLAVVLLLSPVVILAAQTLKYDLAQRSAERHVRTLAAAILPKGEPVRDPAAQVERRLALAQIAAQGGATGLAAVLFKALEDLDQAQLEALLLTPDGAMRATISHANYSDLELLRRALQPSGVGLDEAGSREEGARLVSDVVLRLR